MNKKGFTLVEVILVIAIMALLLLIIVPNVFVLIDKNNENSCNNLVNNIESAAKLYVTNNKYNLDFICDDNPVEITFQMLIDSGDLTLDSTGKMINPIDKSEISLDNTVNVTYNCSTKIFEYEVTGIDCANN